MPSTMIYFVLPPYNVSEPIGMESSNGGGGSSNGISVLKTTSLVSWESIAIAVSFLYVRPQHTLELTICTAFRIITQEPEKSL